MRALCIVIPLSVVTFAITRLLLVILLGPLPDTSFYAYPDLSRALWVGLRFDLKLLAILFGPWLVLITVLRSLPSGFYRYFTRAFWVYLSVVLLSINTLSVTNYYYMTFYQSPINALIFGFLEDDTQAVLATLWTDFPVIRTVLSLLVLTTIEVYACIRFATSARAGKVLSSNDKLTLINVLLILILVFLSRGSLGKFPLRTMHLSVSSNSFINNLVANGPYALWLAYKERTNNQLGKDPIRYLQSLGFDSPAQAYAACFPDTPLENASPPTHRLLPKNSHAETQPPFVVFALMESWGAHVMQFDHAQHNDLLGALRPWVEHKADYFLNALPAQNGTHPTLEGILLDTPITPLTQTQYGYTQYLSSRVLPYQKAGYKTVFLTAGSRAWRQLDPALLRQGFDQIIDQADIVEKYPDATSSTWGVDDEWMFLYANDLLREADANNEKLMLFMLSITNHPPYKIPDQYTPAPLSTDMLADSIAVDASTGQTILETYQYANHHLGEFLNRLAEQSILERTLFVATGDHTTRSITHHADNSQLHLKYGVPILSYIPQAYQLINHVPRTQSWVSHQDIFPTLWAHSLSETNVPIQGHSLYAPRSPETDFAFSFIGEVGGAGLLISEEGAITNLGQPTYYQWTPTHTLRASTKPSPLLKQQGKVARSCLALRDWSIRKQALSNDSATLNMY